MEAPGCTMVVHALAMVIVLLVTGKVAMHWISASRTRKGTGHARTRARRPVRGRKGRSRRVKPQVAPPPSTDK